MKPSSHPFGERLAALRQCLFSSVLLMVLATGPSLAQDISNDIRNSAGEPTVDVRLSRAADRAQLWQKALAAIKADRFGYIREIVDRVRDTARQRGYSPEWAVEWEISLALLDDHRLVEVGLAEEFDHIKALATGSAGTRVFGDRDTDLVYTPVTPCRVLDTRFATTAGLIGPITGGGNVISIFVNDSGFSLPGQGGNPAGCPEVPTDIEASAVVVTITAVPSGSGNFRAFAFGQTSPLASVLNWSPGQNVANTTIVPTCTGCGQDISIQVDGGASHIVVDIAGYFRAPEAAALDVNVLRAQETVADGTGFSLFSPVCPSGFRVTGGGFVSLGSGDNFFSGSRPARSGSLGFDSALGINVADSWLCQGFNNTGSSSEVHCYVACSRVPGR